MLVQLAIYPVSLVGHLMAGRSPAGESPLLRSWFSQPARTASEYGECNHPRNSKRERVISNYIRFLKPYHCNHHSCLVYYLHLQICRQATLPTRVKLHRWLQPGRQTHTRRSYNLPCFASLENFATKSTNTMQVVGDHTSTIKIRISCAIGMHLRAQKTLAC